MNPIELALSDLREAFDRDPEEALVRVQLILLDESICQTRINFLRGLSLAPRVDPLTPDQLNLKQTHPEQARGQQGRSPLAPSANDWTQESGAQESRTQESRAQESWDQESRDWLAKRFPTIYESVLQNRLCRDVRQQRISPEQILAAMSDPVALEGLHRLTLDPLVPDASTEADRRASQETVAAGSLTTGLARITEAWQRHQWEQVQQILDKYDVLFHLLSWSGVDPALTDAFREFVLRRVRQPQQESTFRAAAAVWLRQFLQGRGVTPLRTFTARDWPEVIERSVLVASLQRRPEHEPDWAQQFRNHALDASIGSIKELRKLDPPSDIIHNENFNAFRQDLLREIQEHRDQAYFEWEVMH